MRARWLALGLFGLGLLGLGQAGEVPATVGPVLERAIQAHGGDALVNLKTFREDYKLNASVLGLGVYNIRVRIAVDFPGKRGRFEFFNNGTLESVYQTTPQATQRWSKKDGVKPVDNPPKNQEFAFSPPFKAGVLGLLSVGKVDAEKLSVSNNLELEGLRGTGLVRTGKQYEVTYLIGTDGVMIAERSIFTNDKGEKSSFTMLYEKFKTVSGVKVPMTAQIRSSQIPGFASANLEVSDVDINPTLEPNTFKLP